MAPRLAIAVILALLLALGLTAADCGDQSCESNEECGEGKVCTDTGLCQVISCESSLDCPIESWCNAGMGQCQAGCLNDRDCLPTRACDQERLECFVPGCRSTQLDCEFGQFCNQTSGQCLDAGDVYCRTCENSEDCDSINNWCVSMSGSGQTYCAVDCSNGAECPWGYSCVRIRGPGDVTMGYGCIAPCWEVNP